MRRLFISSLGVVGMLGISVIAFASSQNNISADNIQKVRVVDVLETTTAIVPMEETIVTELATITEQTPVIVAVKLTENSHDSVMQYKVYDEEEAYLLAKIAMAEAENQDIEGKALVMLTVLNRVQDDRFPNTIREVIYQKNQFAPISNGRFDKVEPNDECWKALEMIQAENWDKSQGALYFESKSQSTWHQRKLKFLFQHGAHYFYTEQESEQ